MSRRRKQVLSAVAAALVLTGPALPLTPVAAATSEAAPAEAGPDVFVGEVTIEQTAVFRAVGLDHEDVTFAAPRAGRVAFEAVLTQRAAAALRARGVTATRKQLPPGDPALRALREGVFRSYGEPGGIRDELVRTARAHPEIAELVRIGHSRRGTPILALRVTKDARTVEDGSRPAVLYNGAQHAREWITPEMVRRLMHHVLDGYATEPSLRRLVDARELWFLPVANPDGYDFTFTEGNRLWRKNLRDNDADGRITTVDGVDPNRNFPTDWGYDNEGSSPEPSDQTYRGPRPASEPETRALDSLAERVGFAFHVNYHSAAELLLYGTGFQVNTPTPDDLVYEALAGTDARPAVPGYDPDLSAELYTTNGETTEHMHRAHRTLSFTPEMSTCQTVSDAVPDDPWRAEDCESVFHFPDDEALIEAEFRKNIPFALSLARSAADPSEPVSIVGGTTPDLRIDPFAVSHGRQQPVAVIAKRTVQQLRMHYRVDGGPTRTAAAPEWGGGERYGDGRDVYYGEFRGVVRGAGPGNRVEVWFSGRTPDDGPSGGGARPVESEHFSYRVADDIGGRVLVLAAEDATGISPEQVPPRSRYADRYVQALEEAGYTSDVYDVDANARTAPHPLGVLSHYDAVVWETGDDVIPRAPGQVPGTAAELALDLELSVRDYLNEGGRLLHTGKYAQFAQGADGAYFYNPFQEQQGECTTPGAYPCLPLLNDFLQYWLGAYEYIDGAGTGENGRPLPVRGSGPPFRGFAADLDRGGSARNQDHTASFLTTSSFLPPAQFPQFASAAPLEWDRLGGSPYDPRTGSFYLYSERADSAYKRFSRTVDLTGASTGALTFQMSRRLEPDYDFVFVEAREVGTDRWTTLPDVNGHTGTSPGLACADVNWTTIHPQLLHYQRPAPGCQGTGTTGEWHAATGSSDGYEAWSIDLSRFAGKQVEVSITSASDPGVQGLGVFLDDLALSVGGTTVAQTSFETDGDLAGFSVPGPPPGSPGNGNDWVRTASAFDEGAAVTTEQTVLLGFGAEGLNRTRMTDIVDRSMRHLLGPARP